MGGWVSGYVWYFVELSREPKHVAQQMRYQNEDLSNGYLLLRHRYTGMGCPRTYDFTLISSLWCNRWSSSF